jgi:hypothetical protein
MDYEKLGAFYLGRRVDPESGDALPDLLLYDSKDLTTHAVCVGMTGSGKTGLCIAMLEEAALDGIPALAIDPKGDLGNLLLTFPELRGEDFRPWIEPAEAARHGRDVAEHANEVAERWRKGLAEWGQDSARIRRLREAAEIALYTPGSTAGRPLRVLRSLAAPSRALLEDADLLRERVQATTSGLLSLLGLEADPLQSREAILIANLLERAWREGRDLELSQLLAEIQTPPFARLGVMDLESFFPARDRFALALQLNHLLASPGFAAWLEGEPLDVRRLLTAADGRPRLSIVSIAHLGERERMFFVTLLLGELISWMRTQPGTSSLRAILYMDEVFGYLPPVANPPSKPPLLTLLKQARAYGLGVVLATQNPVDLDYKALSNAGTWLLGRLQTERDKARVLDGLEGGVAATSGGHFDRAAIDRLLSGLESRVFLLHNVHEDAPVLFRSRWALSYLRGPLTRDQIRALVTVEAEAHPTTTASPSPAPPGGERPLLPPAIEEVFLPPAPGQSALSYRPALLAKARLHYVDARAGIDLWESVHLLAPLWEGALDPWSGAQELSAEPARLAAPPAGARFAPLPAEATREKTHAAWRKELKDRLYRERKLTLRSCAALRASSAPGESEADFRARLRQAARERRDLEVEKLRARWAPKLERLRERRQRAETRLVREQDQHQSQRIQSAISFGATLLGALFGRKTISAGTIGRATTAARGVGRTRREAEDVERAEDAIERIDADLAEQEREFEREVAELEGTLDASALELETRELACRKSDLAIESLVLAWTD